MQERNTLLASWIVNRVMSSDLTSTCEIGSLMVAMGTDYSGLCRAIANNTVFAAVRSVCLCAEHILGALCQ